MEMEAVQEQGARRLPTRRSHQVRLTCLIALLAALPRGRAIVQVPNRHTVASIPGDLVLGILVPVHERPSAKQAQTRTCGPVREQYGIQRVEVAFKTIDSINADPNILPNITLGVEIRDSCWHSPIALEQSIEFIRDAMAASEQSQQSPGQQQQLSTPNQLGIGQLQQHLQQAGGVGSRPMRQQQQQQQDQANSSSSLQQLCAPYIKQQLQTQPPSKKIKNLVGVVGPASSGDTVQVQNLLQLFNMPQVGYSATSRDLSNKNFFKYFLRVVPSDKLQAQVLIDLMLAHNWTYITVVYTEGSYGSSLMNAFRERAQEAGICFATLESMPPNADDAEYDELIEAIQNHRNARVVICMCEGRTIGRLFAGFKRRNVSNEYLVVGSDGWADRFDVVERQEEIALGGISIRIHSAYVHDFDNHYFALNPFNNHRNPWFAEFWEQRFQCNLDYSNSQQQQSYAPGASVSQARPAFVRPLSAKVYNRTCNGRESLRQNYKQDAKMAFVQKSIITMALGLDSMQRALCGPNKPGLCAAMLPINGSTFLQHLMNVSFSFLDELVHFDEQGDPPGKYEILNFQRKPPASALDQPALGLSDDNDSDDGEIVRAGGVDSGKSNYDSYATLRVHRSDSDSADAIRSHQLARRHALNQQPSNRHELLSQPPPPSSEDYSATNSYEYVHVGSWKSSDGLSLFGEIQWPTRATLFQHYPTASSSSTPPVSPAGPPAINSTGQPGQGQAGGGGGPGGNSSEPSESAGGLLGGYLAPAHPAGGNDLRPGEFNPTVSSRQVAAPKSVCALPCAKGHAKKIQSDSVKCCWVCVPCRPREYLFNEFKCKACEKGWWPNADQTGCEQIPIEHFDWRSLEGSVSIVTALVGLVLTLAVAAVFIKHNETPVVKSTTRELSYMILFSMLLCYLNTFFLIAKPSQLSCFVTRILPGFSFAMMYGALVTKTNRIARILAGSKKKIITRRPYFMSATAQVLITWLVVLVECAIIVVMLIREPADKTHEFPSDERVVLVCNTTSMGIMAPLGFDFFLIAMCTLYAFKTRNVPENFNEAKFIGFTMYTTLVIWIAFVVIYLSSEHKVTTMCLCISFSALFALILLFFPRCYIIILKPEKNNRSYFKTTKTVRCHIGYQLEPGQNPASAGLRSGSTGGANSSSSGGAGLNINSPEQRLFLASLCEVAAAAAAAANANSPDNRERGLKEHEDQQEHYFEELSSQLADELTMALAQLNNGLDQQAPVRSRTSHCKVSPAASKPTDWEQPLRPASGRPANASSTSPVAQEHTDSNPEQPRALQTLSNREGTSRRDHSEAEHTKREQDRPAIMQLCAQIRQVFVRRSHRKESDKTAVIQQHLRAIRHAENLDRQTHFRRSQVQRLIQRFDSNAIGERDQNWEPGNNPAACKQRHQSGGQLQWPGQEQALASARFQRQLRDFLQEADQAGELLPVPGDESRRLLAAMSQLIGRDNLWRLASVLSRYCKQQQQSNEGTGVKMNPLDLRRAPDRRLALVWLRFLIQMAQKALESVQLLISAAAVASSSGSVRDLTRARASLSAEQSRDLITLNRPNSDVRTFRELNLTSESDLNSKRNRDELSLNLNDKELDTPAVASLRPLPVASATNRGVDNVTRGEQCRQKAASSESASGDGVSLKSDIGRQRSQTGTKVIEQAITMAADGDSEHDDDDDPIGRALERITGGRSGFGIAGQTHRHHHNNQQQSRVESHAQHQRRSPAKMNLNCGDDQFEMALEFRRSAAASKQRPTLTATGTTNDELPLRQTGLPRPAGEKARAPLRLVKHHHHHRHNRNNSDNNSNNNDNRSNQREQQDKRKQLASPEDDQDQDTRLELKPAAANRDDHRHQSICTVNGKGDEGAHSARVSNEVGAQPRDESGQTRPNNLSPNVTTNADSLRGAAEAGEPRAPISIRESECAGCSSAANCQDGQSSGRVGGRAHSSGRSREPNSSSACDQQHSNHVPRCCGCCCELVGGREANLRPCCCRRARRRHRSTSAETRHRRSNAPSGTADCTLWPSNDTSRSKSSRPNICHT